MRFLLLFLICTMSSAAQADCTPQSMAWITLEVVAGELAGPEPAELIDIDRAGCLSVRYPSFDRRAGVYRRQLAAVERAALAADLQDRTLLSFDTEQVKQDIAAREQQFRRGALSGGAQYFRVADGDTYRLSIEDGADSVQIEWYALRQTARRHSEVTALRQLLGMVESLQKLAADDSKTRVADVTP